MNIWKINIKTLVIYTEKLLKGFPKTIDQASLSTKINV